MNLNFSPKHIVILTGAGISAESGIRTFRDSNGLWEDHDIMEVASPSGFDRDPELVHKFYNLRRQQLLSDEVHPNQAHHSLFELEEKFSGKLTIVTQNVDNLHEVAGSKNVLHMHGELLKMKCVETGKSLLNKRDIHIDTPCPCCLKPGNLRPDIVWFGEHPKYMNEIQAELEACDLFVSIGTSGVVYPAAMFVQIAKSAGAHCIEVNLEETQVSDDFDIHLQGPATETVRNLVELILG